jgi:hypothetical protein
MFFECEDMVFSIFQESVTLRANWPHQGNPYPLEGLLAGAPCCRSMAIEIIPTIRIAKKKLLANRLIAKVAAEIRLQRWSSSDCCQAGGDYSINLVVGVICVIAHIYLLSLVGS